MYRLANLLKWKDRSFDLSDENDWLDLLDDFGPSLPRFLLDGSCAPSIPDGDAALNELRQSLVKHPVSSLTPDVGSVWVLFVFDDRLDGLPRPFRRDGVLLPFEWRRDCENHSELLPEALLRLADKVKLQYGDEARDCTLHPSRHFLDAVDFRVDGDEFKFSFDSAWGALATGLHLLLSRKKELKAWPFSTIAYDFENGVPQAVGGLERKLLLAASAGAEEIAVAPVQYREARKTLAALQAEHPKDKALGRLRIYHWRPSGDLRRSVTALAKCNQPSMSRRLIVTSLVVGVLVMGFACVYFKMDSHVAEYKLKERDAELRERDAELAAAFSRIDQLRIEIEKGSNEVEQLQIKAGGDNLAIFREPQIHSLFVHTQHTNCLWVLLGDVVRFKGRKPLADRKITGLMLAAMENDIVYRLNHKMDLRMRLTMNSIFLAHSKAKLNDAKAKESSQYRITEIERSIKAIEEREQIIAKYEKQLESEISQLQALVKGFRPKKMAAMCPDADYLSLAQTAFRENKPDEAVSVIRKISDDSECFSAAYWLMVNSDIRLTYKEKLSLCFQALFILRERTLRLIAEKSDRPNANEDILWLLRIIVLADSNQDKMLARATFQKLIDVIRRRRNDMELLVDIEEFYKPALRTHIIEFARNYEKMRVHNKDAINSQAAFATMFDSVAAIKTLPYCDEMFKTCRDVQYDGWDQEVSKLVEPSGTPSGLVRKFIEIDYEHLIASVAFHRQLEDYLRKSGNDKGADRVLSLVETICQNARSHGMEIKD